MATAGAAAAFHPPCVLRPALLPQARARAARPAMAAAAGEALRCAEECGNGEPCVRGRKLLWVIRPEATYVYMHTCIDREMSG